MKFETDNKLYLGGILPCLNCGKDIDMSKDFHICNAPCKEWLNKQKVALMGMSNGDWWDLKNHKMVRKRTIKRK